MAPITEAKFIQLQALGRKHGMPPFTHMQLNQWKAAREQRIIDGGPFTVLVTGTDGCARHIVDAVLPYLKMEARRKITFVEEPIGWEAMKRAGLSSPLDNVSARFPERTWLAAMESDAILLCAVGSEWDDPIKHPELAQADRPQNALRQLRLGFNLKEIKMGKPIVRELSRKLYCGTQGLASSAMVGDGSWPNCFKPVHGSAPDIFPASGKLEDSIANPLATALTAEMLLRSLGLDSLAQSILNAVTVTLNEGWRTPDIYSGRSGEYKVGTLGMIHQLNTNTM